MFRTLIDAFKDKDIRRKILITLALLAIFRLGAWLPIPGIDPGVFSDYTSSSGNTFLQLMSAVTGGALANGAILALGVSPYITGQIIMQLLTYAIPSLERLSKQGDTGMKKINTITKYVSLVLAIAQGIGITIYFNNNGGLTSGLFGSASLDWITFVMVVVVLVFGAMFTRWLGEKITELGAADGLSLLIFVGIISSASYALYTSFVSAFTGNIDNLWSIIIFLATLVVIFFLIAFMDLAERRVQVQYARRDTRRGIGRDQKNSFPIKMLATGVLPIIFAMSVLSFPQIVMSIFWPLSDAATWYSTYLGAGSWAYSVAVAVLILLFSYFAARMSFKPYDYANRIQADGGFIVGKKPGRETAFYLQRISDRITFFGALFLMFLTIVPTVVFKAIGGTMGSTSLVNAFSATGMIIVVSVALEVDKSLQRLLILRNQKGFLK